ncbi:unnamed protein product [Rotaria sp. Silwood1]|nr:unnamed protein product [Rotaria sp. Silwood1]CAF3871071.1 unnamed protein product [Rotaria sp. Silwood1]
MSITDDNPYFLVSNKGKLLLVLNRIVFKKNKETKTKKYWVCQVAGCGVYVHANIQDIVLKATDNYSHVPHPENIVLKSFRTKVKQRVMKETTSITKIYEEEVVASQMPLQTLAIIPLAREVHKDTIIETPICILKISF